MIDIRYKRAYLPHKNVRYMLHATGHAGYAKEGQEDIVCASASMIFYTLANYLEYIGADDLIGDDGDDFSIECTGLYHDEAVHNAFRMAVFGLGLLAEQYPDNVMVTEEPDD